MSVEADFEPNVLTSLWNSCNRKSNFRPSGDPQDLKEELVHMAFQTGKFLGNI